ncbi:MAG TPA: hypothetical protein VKR53_19585 [Puia sp.]|nr:hypothetical protein [Puia sp.]
MVHIDVILNGIVYSLPNADAEMKFPRLVYIQKGLNNIFEEISAQFPNDIINLFWDEDLKKLNYYSKTVAQQKITDLLPPEHRTLLD